MTDRESLQQIEALLDNWIDADPDAAERFIDSQLARVALKKRLDERRAAGPHSAAAAHTDHPLRHWDRTCPTCIAEAENAAAAQPVAWPSVDELAQQIRWVNGNNKLGAGSLAESILEWMQTRLATPPAAPEPELATAKRMLAQWRVDYDNKAVELARAGARVAELEAALRELVGLKEMKADADRRKQRRDYVFRRDEIEVAAVDALLSDYSRRKPIAWAAARAILAGAQERT
jgi:hypothetical protein